MSVLLFAPRNMWGRGARTVYVHIHIYINIIYIINITYTVTVHNSGQVPYTSR